MANPEHVEILKQGVDAWNKWRQEYSYLVPDLRGADLKGFNLSGADLRVVHFSGADLRDTIIREANLFLATLRGADLSGADLGRSNLSDTDFDCANLSGADIPAAKLYCARLSGADLSGAYLASADLNGADLGAANFTNVVIGSTLFANNDLSQVKGLEAVEHYGPSTIGIDTIYKSHGKIPEVFMRGCGVPESLILQLPALINALEPIQFYSCFISYSHADKSFARRLHDALQGRGIRCWLDEHQLLPGQKIYTEVDRGIRLWDKVLLCCSKDSLTSWWVDNEIKIAFDKEQKLWKERGDEVLALIPLNLDDYLLSGQWQSGMATEVKARLAADFTGWETDNRKFEEQFEKLVRALRADAGGREVPPQSRL